MHAVTFARSIVALVVLIVGALITFWHLSQGERGAAILTLAAALAVAELIAPTAAALTAFLEFADHRD